MKAKETQDTQVILGDAGLGVFDEADAPGMQIIKAAQRVNQSAIGAGIKRVHGEITARGIVVDGS